MKRTNTPKPNALLKWLILAVVIIILGVTWYAYTRHATQNENGTAKTSSDNSLNTPPTEQERQAETMGDADRESSKQAQGEGSEITLTITALNQTDSTLQLRVLIPSLTQGICRLRLESGTKNIDLSVDTQALASTSTCKGFDIPLSQLSKGTWRAQVEYVVSEQVKGSIAQEVVIK